MKPSSPNATRPTLLFIPDISGFTEFVSATEITHSQHIIRELLEILIDANEMGLEVSEIEGDAILFYLQDRTPTAAELLAQVQRMYVRFHAHLKKYETHRICHCGACSTANNLKLKVIAHFGDVGKNQVREHSKLFGKDVIVAHRLMKNDVPHDEYVLITHQLMNACSSWVQIQEAAWATPEQRQGGYDFGSIDHCYIPLSALMAHVPEPAIEDYGIPGKKTLLIEMEAVIEAPIDLVFNVVADLTNRHRWVIGLRGTDRLNSKITRTGSTHRCILKGKESDPFFVLHDLETGRDFVTFTETNHRDGICNVYTMRRIGNRVTRLRYASFLKHNVFKECMFRLFMKKKYLEVVRGSLDNLNACCKELDRTGEPPAAQIVLDLPAMEEA